jgi:hypothetical protein
LLARVLALKGCSGQQDDEPLPEGRQDNLTDQFPVTMDRMGASTTGPAVPAFSGGG